MSIVLNGIKLGIVLAFLIGPVFFALIQTSIEKGFLKGVMVALGVSLADLIYVLVCYLGLVQLIEDPSFRTYMGYIGGTLLVMFGLYHLVVKSRRSILPARSTSETKTYKYFIKGFVMNSLSPMVPIFWIGTIGVASVDFGYSKNGEFFIFFASLLLTVLITDVSKAFLAGRLRKVITPKRMMWTNIAVGLAMVAFGVRLIWLAYQGWGLPVH